MLLLLLHGPLSSVDFLIILGGIQVTVVVSIDGCCWLLLLLAYLNDNVDAEKLIISFVCNGNVTAAVMMMIRTGQKVW